MLLRVPLWRQLILLILYDLAVAVVEDSSSSSSKSLPVLSSQTGAAAPVAAAGAADIGSAHRTSQPQNSEGQLQHIELLEALPLQSCGFRLASPPPKSVSAVAAAAPAAAAAAPTLTEVTRATVQAGAAATGPPKMDENRNPQGPAGGAPVAPVDDGDLPWVERYRPKTLSDILSHDDIIQTSKSSQTLDLRGFQRYVDKGQLPHLLFHGPPGTGKTSTILAVARQLYGSQQASHVLELNASDDRGIGSVRELVKTFAETTSASFSLSGAAPSGPPKLKLIILDEADQMTSAAQNALRRIMETYARNVRFCLICNFVNKITPAIQSRCTRCKILGFASAEEESGRSCEIREAASMAHPGEPVDGELVHRVLGLPQPSEVKSIMQTLLEKDLVTCSSALHSHMQTMKLPVPVALTLVTRLADIEERLALGSGDFVQVRPC
ncbi:activator 1 36 kDa, putative [Eimeria acervulina]|uniref:Activator 1 36 kDa, putative n=1 Tax=Eimeria acervulina TaxID=5801 RepID=U6GWB7_EIMAC|nr:activator 1 36 kDa, putative [Eimeria acervulina]CDI83538.1 activator 1 36 kDa, putative [Eimeria acervulina]